MYSLVTVIVVAWTLVTAKTICWWYQSLSVRVCSPFPLYFFGQVRQGGRRCCDVRQEDGQVQGLRLHHLRQPRRRAQGMVLLIVQWNLSRTKNKTVWLNKLIEVLLVVTYTNMCSTNKKQSSSIEVSLVERLHKRTSVKLALRFSEKSRLHVTKRCIDTRVSKNSQ